GMKSQEAAISDNMLITMKNDALGLSEVVVTALGIPVEKKSLGTATQVVGGDEVNTSGTSNVMNELEGKVSGLTVISSAGDPGAGTFMNLRGITSLTGNNQPLMVVDGVPIDNSINVYDPTNAGFQASGANGNLTGAAQPTNRGLDINPSDIESITVLKGPAATALYGIQAASGALIITTKKGGKHHAGLGIEFNSSETWSTYNKLPDMQNTYGQGTAGFGVLGLPGATPQQGDAYYGPTSTDFYGVAKKFSWGPPIDSLYWTGPQPSNAANNYLGSYDPHGAIVEKGAAGWNSGLQQVTPYNPYDFFQTGVAADNNISFSGGSDNTSFRMSLGNLTQTGIVPLSKYVKNTFNINGSTALSKRLKLSGGANYTESVTNKVQQGSNTSGVMLGLLRTPPNFDNSNGYGNSDATNSSIFELPDPTTSQRDYRGGPGYDNPFWTVNQNPFVSTLNRVYGFGQADYNLINKPKTTVDLTYRLGGDMYLQDDKNVYDVGSNGVLSGAGGVYLTDYINAQLNSDLIATIKHTFSDNFKATVILGQNYFNLTNDVRFSNGTNFVIPHFLDMSNSTYFQSAEAEGGKRTSAWYGEAILDYKSQLFLTLTGRDETSSTLPAASDVFFYPSVSGSWVFTETFKMSTNKILPYGKLRISYADVGKDAPAEALQTYYHSPSILDGFTSGISFPYNGISGFELSNDVTVLGGPTLTPEKTNSLEVGTDLAFLDNRISLSLTYYSEETTDGIFQVPISYATGYAALNDNAADVTNKGEEVTLNTTPIKTKSGFQWDLGFNWSHNQNEVVSLSPGVNELLIAGFQNASIEALPGQPFGVIYGTDYVKTSSGQLLIDDNPNDLGYGMPIPGSASQALGNTQPKWIGGMNNSFTFKGFSLGVVLTTRQGGDIWDGTQGAMEYFGTEAATDNRNQPVTWGGQLGHLDIQGNIVHNTATGTAPGPGSSNTVATTYSEYYWQNVGSSFIGPTSTNVVDGSYVRISQISFSYKLPDRWVRKAHFTNVTVTLFANNPVLWTKYPGVDPETSLAGPANGQGLDYFNNPGAKSYGVRLNLGL
ncbi:MAG TPA: SusC/RagA family TonB-linked outer membrane protein, partial [Bacteroidia bacterium]|nr:SusC/RagA family TonB-linked outer membrane protein [Bacteroidia bacterium]